MSRKIDIETAVETAWKILEGLGYKRKENQELEETVQAVFWTAPYEETDCHAAAVGGSQ